MFSTKSWVTGVCLSIVVLMLSGCWTRGHRILAPTSLSVSLDQIILQGLPVSANTSYDGDLVTDFSVEPDLPAGLQLDPVTGASLSETQSSSHRRQLSSSSLATPEVRRRPFSSSPSIRRRHVVSPSQRRTSSMWDRSLRSSTPRALVADRSQSGSSSPHCRKAFFSTKSPE